jgi:cohesin domain-containing protein
MPRWKPAAAALALAFALGAIPARAVQKLTLGSAAVPPGQSAAISLGYVGDGSVVGLQLDVTFDPAVLGSPSVAAGSGIAGQVVQSAVVASGRLRLVIYAPQNVPALGNGELARLSFNVSNTAPSGQSTLALAGVVLGNANATAVAPTELDNGAVLVLTGLRFYSLTPCRLVDTRNATGPLGGPALPASGRRSFTLASVCNVPPTALALSINVTVVQPAAAGDLRFFPADLPVPLTSVVNFRGGQTRTNNAIIGLSTAGALTVQNDATGTVHLVVDVNGYFQ